MHVRIFQARPAIATSTGEKRLGDPVKGGQGRIGGKTRPTTETPDSEILRKGRKNTVTWTSDASGESDSESRRRPIVDRTS